MNILYILVAILLLGILVTVHEFGHFVSARLLHIGVQEYSIGFGPKLVGWTGKKSGIRYSVRLLPMGGYCAFYSPDPENGIRKEDPRCFSNAAVWKRMITVLMGPVMNFFLAFVVLTGFFMSTGMVIYDPCILEVEENGPAYTAGMMAGDSILSINGQTVADKQIQLVTATISAWKEGDSPLSFSVLGIDGTTRELEITPFYDEESGRYRTGVTLAQRIRTKTNADGSVTYDYQPISLGNALTASWNSCVRAGGMIFGALKDLVTTGKGAEETAGIIGTVAIISDQVRQGGMESFVNLLVIISINLGIMNLLPFPGLDGSRFLFMTVEAIRRKPIPEEKENLIHGVGMALLFGLMIFLMFKDTLTLMK